MVLGRFGGWGGWAAAGAAPSLSLKNGAVLPPCFLLAPPECEPIAGRLSIMHGCHSFFKLWGGGGRVGLVEETSGGGVYLLPALRE